MKHQLIGNFGQLLETTGGIVGRVSTLALYGLPLQRDQSLSGVQTVTAAQVRKFAAANLGGKDVNIVVCVAARCVIGVV